MGQNRGIEVAGHHLDFSGSSQPQAQGRFQNGKWLEGLNRVEVQPTALVGKIQARPHHRNAPHAAARHQAFLKQLLEHDIQGIVRLERGIKGKAALFEDGGVRHEGGIGVTAMARRFIFLFVRAFFTDQALEIPRQIGLHGARRHVVPLQKIAREFHAFVCPRLPHRQCQGMDAGARRWRQFAAGLGAIGKSRQGGKRRKRGPVENQIADRVLNPAVNAAANFVIPRLDPAVPRCRVADCTGRHVGGAGAHQFAEQNLHLVKREVMNSRNYGKNRRHQAERQNDSRPPRGLFSRRINRAPPHLDLRFSTAFAPPAARALNRLVSLS